MFNLLNKTLVTSLDDAGEAAKKLISIVTPENVIDAVGISESLGLGISNDLKLKSEAIAMAQLEAEDKAPNEQPEGQM